MSFSAIFKALADTIQHHYDRSIFKEINFFNPLIQGKLIPLTKYPFDAWHLSNSGMIFTFILAASISKEKDILFKFIISSIIFIVTFNLFYNKIFI